MSVPRTIRQGKLGKRDLRLVAKDGMFYGLADGKLFILGHTRQFAWSVCAIDLPSQDEGAG